MFKCLWELQFSLAFKLPPSENWNSSVIQRFSAEELEAAAEQAVYCQLWEQPAFDTLVFTRCHFSSTFCRLDMKVISCNRKNSEGEKHSAHLLRWSSICSPCSPAETALKGLCSWCALPNSAYFLHISPFAILNRDLRFYRCMLHSESTARVSGIVWSPQGWSP